MTTKAVTLQRVTAFNLGKDFYLHSTFPKLNFNVSPNYSEKMTQLAMIENGIRYKGLTSAIVDNDCAASDDTFKTNN